MTGTSRRPPQAEAGEPVRVEVGPVVDAVLADAAGRHVGAGAEGAIPGAGDDDGAHARIALDLVPDLVAAPGAGLSSTALSTCGRSMVTRATWPSSSKRTSSTRAAAVSCGHRITPSPGSRRPRSSSYPCSRSTSLVVLPQRGRHGGVPGRGCRTTGSARRARGIVPPVGWSISTIIPLTRVCSSSSASIEAADRGAEDVLLLEPGDPVVGGVARRTARGRSPAGPAVGELPSRVANPVARTGPRRAPTRARCRAAGSP